MVKSKEDCRPTRSKTVFFLYFVKQKAVKSRSNFSHKRVQMIKAVMTKKNGQGRLTRKKWDDGFPYIN
jgi:hypothetical protein